MTSISPLSRVTVLLIAVVAVSSLLLASGVQASGSPPATEHYIVRAGDTLWELAGRVTAPEGDRREAVHQIRHLNGLQDSTLMPGQVLEIPDPASP
ncbi:MAG: LysM peptidoglycan-binding domain-containing protein [Actinomycetota bacterium]|nr:LysM peptidoglycan-binding domain-containing protein [Actinomycetota bacterium]